MYMSITQQHQRGMGMVEVLVALLLLAVGVLGFSALQSYAVYSTAESLNRTQALTMMRGLAERIRANGTSSNTLDIYKGLMASGKPVPPTERCRSGEGSPAGCTVEQLAAVDVYDARNAVWESGIQLGMATCPGTVGVNRRQCLLAAWDKTRPTIATDPDSCMTLDGVYRMQSTCIVMEVF